MDWDLVQSHEKTEELGEINGLLCFPAGFLLADL